MVAGNEDDLQPGHGFGGLLEEVEEELFGARGGIGGVEHVARHDEGVGLPGAELPQEPVEEVAVFAGAVVAVEIVA